MDWLKTVVPLLGTALGGPLGGAAASFIASKLGLPEGTVEAVTKVLGDTKLSADQIAQLKLAEIDFQKFLEDNKIKLESLEVEDRKSAREMQTASGSWVPGVMAILVTAGFFGILGYMLTADYKPSDALLVMLGSLGTAWASIIAFYFGSSQGSAQKNALLDKLVSR